MAGWKLRKDKSPDEAAPEAEAHAGGGEEAPTAVPGWDSPGLPGAADGLPAFEDDGPGHSGAVIALGGDAPALVPASDFEMPAADFEAADALHFDDDDDAPPLADYTQADTPPASVYAPNPPDVPTPEPAIAFEPGPAHGAGVYDAPEAESAGGRGGAAEDLGYLGGIPAVAPFVMDMPAPEDAPAPAPHRLVMRVGRLSASFEITKDVTVIGRPDSALHYYPDVEIETDDAVSRRHAEVVKAPDGHYFLQDTGSTNGTRLNGETLPAREERPLVHGDRIHVGERTEIIFE